MRSRGHLLHDKRKKGVRREERERKKNGKVGTEIFVTPDATARPRQQLEQDRWRCLDLCCTPSPPPRLSTHPPPVLFIRHFPLFSSAIPSASPHPKPPCHPTFGNLKSTSAGNCLLQTWRRVSTYEASFFLNFYTYFFLKNTLAGVSKWSSTLSLQKYNSYTL